MKRLKVLYADIDLACQYIARKVCLNDIKDIDSVYGVKRGGFHISELVSRYAHIKLITEKKLLKPSTLIVDEIVDSGKTRGQYKDFKFASVFVRDTYKERNLYFTYSTVPTGIWLVFPWEIEYEENLDWFSGELNTKEL